jgi:GntR family transcriptional regulator/MocR family aminotransferase
VTKAFDIFFHLNRESNTPLYVQIRQNIINAIFKQSLSYDQPIPSTRQMASLLKVSRNTVVMAYDDLISDDFLLSKSRRGYFINPKFRYTKHNEHRYSAIEKKHSIDWTRTSLSSSLTDHSSITLMKALYRKNLEDYAVNNVDFPFVRWRECHRDSLDYQHISYYQKQNREHECSKLIKQIKYNLLNRKGIFVSDEEIFITLGTEQALAMITQLLFLDVDRLGVIVSSTEQLNKAKENGTKDIHLFRTDQTESFSFSQYSECTVTYVPSNPQVSTNIKLAAAIMKVANEKNQIIIEDCTINDLNGSNHHTLKALDKEKRVIYIGSFMAPLTQELQLGYIVAPAPFTEKLRGLRRSTSSYPAINNQRTLALFIERGHYTNLCIKLAN